MKWLTPAWATLSTLFLAVPALAQVAGRPLEFSGGAGVFAYDTRARVQVGGAYTGTVGWRLAPWLALEGVAAFGPSKADSVPKQTHNFTNYGVDLRWNLRPAESQAVPFVLTGMGYGASSTGGHEPDKLERGAGSLGFGLLLNLSPARPRAYFRIQVRDVLFRDRDAKEFSHRSAATAGLHFVWGGKFRDQDLDGVRDWLDQCPNTPIGAKVDAPGCPTDADRDSVPDGLDKCDNTPFGCRVDKNGCPIDSDGDGVCDGLDQCAGTPQGESVDAKGCPNDLDHDGVPSPQDQCPDTPSGCKVDDNGCSIDSDHDGVCDGIDRCPDTPADLKVDANGCPIEVNEREDELFGTGAIRIRGLEFEPGSSAIPDSAQHVLDVIGQTLARWPAFQVEVGGHTDAKGSEAANVKLSEARAIAVRDFLLQHTSSLKPEQFTVVGYGGKKPIAPNTTDEGRAHNRRIDVVVKNRDALMRELQRRKLLKP